MTRYDYPDSSQATIRPLTAEQFAERLARRGTRIHRSGGHYWRVERRGFYLPLYSLYLLNAEEARRPGPGWGFVVGLEQDSLAAANASIPMHLLSDVSTFSEASVTRNTRSARRRLLRRGFRFVVVTDEQIFHDQGYDLMREWRQETTMRVPSREDFLKEITRQIHDPASLVVGALDGDRLMGYTVAWAVDDAAYLEGFAFATSARGLRLSAVMNFELAAALRDTNMVRRVTPGIAKPEWPGPTTYKIEQGYPIVHIPARLSIPRPIAWYLRSRRPMEYYRLTGELPAALRREDQPGSSLS